MPENDVSGLYRALGNIGMSDDEIAERHLHLHA
jgi:hypothetical protein